MGAHVVTVNEVLDGHVKLDIQCLDRVYLNIYVPILQTSAQVVAFLSTHLGFPFPSPALFNQVGQRFRRGSGMTCWRRLAQWHEAGVCQRLHEVLLAELHAGDRLDWSKAVVDGSHVRALKGGLKPVRVRSRARGPARSTM